MRAKACKGCGETKPDTGFSKDASKRDGLQSRCKDCDSIATAARYMRNAEKIKAVSAKWRSDNPGKSAAYVAEWAAANPEKMLAFKAKWKAANPEALRIHGQNRRARERANGGKLSAGLATKLFKLQRGKCACCHVSIADGYHLDHVISLATGGPNEDRNMQLLCGPCNMSKGAKHPVDFMQQRGFLL